MQEFKKWCPAFKILTYFGSPKERKAKRMGWSKPNSFHVCITTYTLILQVCVCARAHDGLTARVVSHLLNALAAPLPPTGPKDVPAQKVEVLNPG